ncbi:MAG: DUF4097 family beta strand repeat-containing protein [Terriglobales bacterium]
MKHQPLHTKLLLCAALAAAFLLTLQAARAQDYPVRLPDQVTRKSFALGSAPFVKLDNVNGKLLVVGDGGSQVSLTATETIRAQSEDLARQAQRQVTLQVRTTGDSLEVYVDGPFRGRHWENPGYEVSFALELHVPAAARVNAGSVNGKVTLQDVGGAFQAQTVNGAVEVAGARAAGSAHTVNGSIKADFNAVPRADCSFHTVNGSIHLTLPRDVNAVLLYKTFNGAVYTDFAVTPLPEAAAASQSGGMRVFRRHRQGRGQIGRGGPTLTVNTLNGSIYIKRGM